MSVERKSITTTRNLIGLLILGLFLAGCEAQPRANRGNSRKVAKQDLPDKATKNLDAFRSTKKDEPKTDTPIDKAAQEESNPTENDSKADAEKPPQETDRQEERSSRLDEAIKKLNAKEPVDLHTEQPVPDREVHEALIPLIEKHWIRLHPGYEVWLDTKGKQVFVGGRISIHEGMLEMFACPIQTKDHESVIATISNAEIIHAGLLASGAIAGRPTRWMPEFVSAFGPKCEMNVIWMEGEERKEVRAQEMIMDLETGKELDSGWVFCGSKVWTNPENPEDSQYFADHGELISVSNFPTSMMDLEIESSNANSGLRFQANSEKIPSPGTPVLIQIKPDPTTNPTAEQLAKADREIAEAERKLEEEYEKARQERKARIQKQKEEDAKRKAELEKDNNQK